MKHNIHILSFLIAALSIIMGACSDSIDLPANYSGIDTDGIVHLTFSIPTVETVSTRTDNSELTSVTVLIFKGENDTDAASQIMQLNVSDSGDNLYSCEFPLSEGLKNNSDLIFYFIANSKQTFSNTKIVDLKATTANSEIINDDGKWVMSGKASLSDLSATIPLIRNGAKISIIDYTSDENGEYANWFIVIGAASTSALAAGAETILTNPDNIDNNENTDNNEIILHPTHNTGDTFLIIRAYFEGIKYFYRLNLQKEKDDNGKPVYIDIKPNHHYQVIIENIYQAGETTIEAAINSDGYGVTYDIHDHSPAIFNMISDGVHELGVTHEIIYTNGVSEANNTYEYCYIKLVSKIDSSEESDFSIDNFSDIPDWLSLSVLGIVESGDYELEDGTTIPITGGSGTESDPNDKGTLYRCKLGFNSTRELGDLEANIKVTWQGLTRTIHVVWNRAFTGSDLCDVTLTIYDANGGEQFSTSEYWSFLAGDGDNNGVRLFGAGEDENNGKARDEGLHFPVMYGIKGENGDKRWSYSYNISFAKSALPESDFDYTFTLTGDATIKNHVTINGQYNSYSGTHNNGNFLTVTVTRPGNTDPNTDYDYTYGNGKLTLKITPTGSETQARITTEYHINLYHTGFFHKNTGEEHRVEYSALESDTKDLTNYYYYEVIPVTEDGKTRYWLDRNISAKSAAYYVQGSGGATYYGDPLTAPLAAGGYYQAADYGGSTDYAKIYTDIAPPGYEIPDQEAWSNVRNSANFDTSTVGGFYHCCYNWSGGKIYFPRTRHMEESAISGESRAGYYWTSTPASGLEKDEVGRWLKSLFISGNTTSYISANVQTYAMPVRCCNVTDTKSSTIFRTAFNVSGATHVYLYTIDDDGNKTAVTTWPGKMIGNYITMDDGWFNFSYESTTFSADQFYVIFNFMDENGQIHTFSNDGSGNVQVTTNISINELEGWKVIGNESEKYPSLKDPHPLISEYTLDTPTENCWWYCNLESKKIYCYSQTSIYRIYWPINWQDGTYGYDMIEFNSGEPTAKGSVTSKGQEKGYYYWESNNYKLNFRLIKGTSEYKYPGIEYKDDVDENGNLKQDIIEYWWVVTSDSFETIDINPCCHFGFCYIVDVKDKIIIYPIPGLPPEFKED